MAKLHAEKDNKYYFTWLVLCVGTLVLPLLAYALFDEKRITVAILTVLLTFLGIYTVFSTRFISHKRTQVCIGLTTFILMGFGIIVLKQTELLRPFFLWLVAKVFFVLFGAALGVYIARRLVKWKQKAGKKEPVMTGVVICLVLIFGAYIVHLVSNNDFQTKEPVVDGGVSGAQVTMSAAESTTKKSESATVEGYGWGDIAEDALFTLAAALFAELFT